MFYALLIDTKDSKVSGRGSYIRTGVSSGDLPRVSLALSRQLDGPGRRARKDVTPTQKSFEPEMVFVEGGTFDMGCTAEQNGCLTDEKPVHPVTLSSFYIGKYEVTREQWIAIMSGAKGRVGTTINDVTATFTQDISDPSAYKDDDQLPIEMVSREDITGKHDNTGADLTEVEGYLERLNKLTGKNYRLPTEAEWEYAARGGKHRGPHMYSGSNTVGDVAWYSGNSSGSTKTHVVGGKNPNALGIYDMSGNVWEYCSDWYGATYYSTTANGVTNPTGPTGSLIVIRGGCMKDIASYQRTTIRSRAGQGGRYSYVGFRVVLPAQ
jgi:formylglycine-generating enzyme required for sulfatase activity